MIRDLLEVIQAMNRANSAELIIKFLLEVTLHFYKRAVTGRLEMFRNTPTWRSKPRSSSSETSLNKYAGNKM